MMVAIFHLFLLIIFQFLVFYVYFVIKGLIFFHLKDFFIQFSDIYGLYIVFLLISW